MGQSSERQAALAAANIFSEAEIRAEWGDCSNLSVLSVEIPPLWLAARESVYVRVLPYSGLEPEHGLDLAAQRAVWDVVIPEEATSVYSSFLVPYELILSTQEAENRLQTFITFTERGIRPRLVKFVLETSRASGRSADSAVCCKPAECHSSPTLSELVVRRGRLLADYKEAMGLHTDAAVYDTRSSGIYRSEFYKWRDGRLLEGSKTAKNFEHFLTSRQLPVRRSKSGRP